MEDARGFDLTSMGIPSCLNQSPPFFFSQVVFRYHGNLDIIKAADQFFTGILKRHPVASARMAGQGDKVPQTVTAQGSDDIDKKSLEGVRRNRNGAGMAGG
jgi:hypothetical protein